MIQVISGSARNPRATELLQASHALMLSLFPPESCHFLSIDALCTPDIQFYEGQIDGHTQGCCALAHRNGYGEVKSMFIDPAARGSGLSDALMTHLITEARAAALPALRLETGSILYAAHKVYQRHGFDFCGPFGNYTEHPDSLFMEKSL